jgi:hypothetical protein
MRINSVDPGFTATDFNQNRGVQTLEEGTDAIMQMATIGPDGPTATFVSHGGPVPWEEPHAAPPIASTVAASMEVSSSA